MKSLVEYFYEEYDTDFESEKDAEEFLQNVLQSLIDEPFHHGDCIKQNISCRMCMVTDLLDHYYNYTKEEFNRQRL